MPAREIYVPAPAVRARPETKSGRRRPEPPPSPTVRVGRIFRGVPWDGMKSNAYAAPPRLGALAKMNVRSAIARTAWTGESIAAVTSEQAARTVEAVLAAFSFDKEDDK